MKQLLIAAIALGTALPMSAVAQEKAQTQEETKAQKATTAQKNDKAQKANQDASAQDMSEESEAAELMIGRIYVREPVSYWEPEDVITKLRDLGYTNIRDFDVEWGEYEVEATSPAGEDVEIEVDAVTGAILDIDENWF